MQKSNAPTKLTIVFASGTGAGPVNVIPLTPGATSGTASYQTGFTSVNMEPTASGGVPPFGADFNGLFQDATKARIWQQAGYMYPFDSTFAGNSNIGGYPAGSVLMMASGKGIWINQSDNNSVNPDTTGASGWLGIAAAGTSTINTTGGTVTPDPSVLGVTTLLITGALTANASVVLPLNAGAKWIVVNNTTGSYSVTVQGATGTGVQVAQGTSNAAYVFTDGTNFYATSANVSGLYLPINGNAVSASKLANARTIAMTGDVAWSVSFDGSANVTATGTIQAGAVSLSKMANLTANTLLGNPTASAATPQAITLANGLVFSGTTLGLGSITVTGMSNSGSASITGNLTVGGNATVSGNISVVGSGTPEIEMKSTGTGGHDWFLVSVGPSWGGGLSAGCLSFFDNTAGANRGYFDPSGNLNLLNFLYVNEYLISTSQYTVLANNGSNGAILLRPNGAFSATGQLELDSSGAVTINGNLTVTGTINFDTSDATLKDLGDPIEPRPFHRLPYHAYRRLDTGSRGWGPTAQGVASIAPEYTDRRTMLVGGEDRSVLFMSKQQITMDTAFWAGRQVDLLWEEIQRLRDELQAYGAH